MRILAIDYGRAKIGLATSTGSLAEPLKVIRFESKEEANREVAKVVEVEKVEKVVIGVSEGKMAEETREFGKQLGERLRMTVVFQDETLSSKDAQRLSIEAGIKRKKRKSLEDAYSAALILQSYLDSTEIDFRKH